MNEIDTLQSFECMTSYLKNAHCMILKFSSASKVQDSLKEIEHQNGTDRGIYS